jgi:metal-responsive CopG/Arc/MetJ family transcriptional regulator
MADRHAKFACSVEASVLERIERLRARTGETRSALVSRALLHLVEKESKAERIRRYIEAYQEKPESRAEIAAAKRVARQALREIAWEGEDG